MRRKRLDEKRRKRRERERRHAAYKSTRRCGGCRECCYVFPLGAKPHREWCKWVTESGCGRHDASRPDICKKYECAWLHSNWPITLRPDRCRLVVSLRRLYRNHPIINIAASRPEALDSREYRIIVTMMKAAGCIILLGDGIICKHLGLSREDADRIFSMMEAEGQQLTQEYGEIDFW